MAEASDTASARFVQRQKPQFPVRDTAAQNCVASPARRDMLCAVAVATLAAAVPASAGEAEDPHHEWKLQLDEVRRVLADLPSAETEEAEDARDRVLDHEWALQGMIMTTPARTLGGLRLQLQEAVDLISEHKSNFGDGRDLRCFEAALATVEQLAGRA